MAQTILDLDIQNVTGSVLDANGYVSFLVDNYGEEGSDQYDNLTPYGLLARPLDPQVDPDSKEPLPGQACSVLTFASGSEYYGMPCTDPRAVALLPNVDKGETIVHNGFGVFTKYDKTGRISHSTTTSGGTSAGQSIAEIIAPDKFQRFAPWGRETFDASGYSVKHVGGGQFVLGYMGGLLPGLKSTATVKADMVRIVGAAVGIGPSNAPQMPVAKAEPLVAVLESISTALEALAAGVAGIPTGGAAAAGAAAAAIASMQAAIASALLQISTTTAIS